MKYIFLILVVLSLGFTDLMAQTLSKSQLEKEKKENLENLKRAKAILSKTRKEKSSSVNQLRTINRQITDQTRQIELLGKDLEHLDRDMAKLVDNGKELEVKLEAQKKEYAAALYQSAKKNNTINQFSFLFSAQSFNDFIMRYKYLEQYADSRKTQKKEIEELQAKIETQKQSILAKKQEKTGVIKEKNNQALELEGLKSKQALVVSELSKREKEVNKEVRAYQASVRKLDNRINDIIRREIAKRKAEEARLAKIRAEEARIAKEKARAEIKKAEDEGRVVSKELEKAANAVALPETPKVALVGSSFGSNKNRIPWPVKNGIISDRFGVKTHPLLKKVQVDNNGVSIQTATNAQVTAVFDGVVMDVSSIPGMNNVVAIQHGDYYTIYANLNSVGVSLNQQVAVGQYLGTAANNDGIPEINFQIWHKFSKLNPEHWLGKK